MAQNILYVGLLSNFLELIMVRVYTDCLFIWLDFLQILLAVFTSIFLMVSLNFFLYIIYHFNHFLEFKKIMNQNIYFKFYFFCKHNQACSLFIYIYVLLFNNNNSHRLINVEWKMFVNINKQHVDNNCINHIVVIEKHECENKPEKNMKLINN